jgi:hypothetical protein
MDRVIKYVLAFIVAIVAWKVVFPIVTGSITGLLINRPNVGGLETPRSSSSISNTTPKVNDAEFAKFKKIYDKIEAERKIEQQQLQSR